MGGGGPGASTNFSIVIGVKVFQGIFENYSQFRLKMFLLK